MLLAITCDELVKTQLHHRHVQQVGGAHGLSEAVFPGEFGDDVEYLVVVHIDEADLAGFEMLLQKRQARLILSGRKQRYAIGVTEPRLPSSDV